MNNINTSRKRDFNAQSGSPQNFKKHKHQGNSKKQSSPRVNQPFKSNDSRHSMGSVGKVKNLAAARMQNLRKSLPAVLDSNILQSGQCSKLVIRPEGKTCGESPVRTNGIIRTLPSFSSSKNSSLKTPTDNLTRTFANERLKKLKEDLKASTNVTSPKSPSFSPSSTNSILHDNTVSSNVGNISTPRKRPRQSTSPDKINTEDTTPLAKMGRVESSSTELESSSTEHFQTPRSKLLEQFSSPSTSNFDNVRPNNEEMEWETIPEEKIISNIQKVRQTVLSEVLKTAESTFFIKQEKEEADPTIKSEKQKVFIITDTNVFLNKLRVVKDIINFEFSQKISICVVIPWMVLQELDFFKNQGKLQKQSTAAIRFINQELMNKNPKVKGQSAVEACDNKINCCTPDDRILDCCLQYNKENNIVVILSDDINLKNKALVSSLEAYSSEEVLMKLQSRFPTASSKPPPAKVVLTPEQEVIKSKLKVIHNLLCKLFRKILQIEMLNAYGEVWLKMTDYKPNWTVPVLLRCYLKYWTSVFSMVFPKHLLPCIEKLLRVFDNCKTNERDLNQLIHAALDVCLHLQNVSEEYFQRIMPCLKELKAQL